MYRNSLLANRSLYCIGRLALRVLSRGVRLLGFGMTIAMLIAHLMGDYVLQTNKVARRKSESLGGVLLHGLIVLVVTVLIALSVERAWWLWAIIIGLIHVSIDAGNYWSVQTQNWFGRKSALFRFTLDQILHLGSIMTVLAISGELSLLQAVASLVDWTVANPITLMGYVFITMPCWILLEFFVYGMIAGSPPDFSQQKDKYPGILERVLVTTLVLMGQLPLALMVPLPRLVLESPRVMGHNNASVYVVKLLASTAIAVLVGQLLR